MIAPATPADTDAPVEIAVSTGLFTKADANLLLRDVLDAIHDGRLGDGHHVCVWRADAAGPPGGWVYFAAHAKADGVWDLWWIGVAPNLQGRGIGKALLRFVEEHAKAAGGRVLLIETSALPSWSERATSTRTAATPPAASCPTTTPMGTAE